MAFGATVRSSHIQEDYASELGIFIDSDTSKIDEMFDKLEQLLAWEMSKTVVEIDSIKVSDCIWFSSNGLRSESDISREGQEVMSA